MKSRIIKWMFLVLGIVLISTLCYRYRYHHRVASDYERFLNSLRIDLPKVAEAESWDNYDRGASRWDCLEHVIRFENSLSDKTVTKLDRLCERNQRWSKEENPNGTIYEYRSEREWNSDLYFFKEWYLLCFSTTNLSIRLFYIRATICFSIPSGWNCA